MKRSERESLSLSVSSAIGKLASGFLVIHQLRAADIRNSAIKLRQPTFDSYRDRTPIPLSRIVGAKCQSARPKCMPNPTRLIGTALGGAF
jgi:hypothetical protein